MPLRPYQQQAVDALFGYFETKSGNPLIVLPTGSGKTHVQSGFIDEVLSRWPDERFLLLSHVKELLLQNASKLKEKDVGIYSAGLSKRQLGHRITVAGIQSIYKKAHEVGDISIVIIDECHLVSPSTNTMYQKFLTDLKEFCPKFRTIGMSATPYRLDSGALIKGENKIFTDIVFKISIRELIEQGYLAPIRTADTAGKIDTSNVKLSGKEFVIRDLSDAAKPITEKALDEAERLCLDRNSWLVFCCSVDHANVVASSLRSRSIDCSVVLGETPGPERDKAIRRFRDGEIKALVSVGVLTTGFDAPNADALICLRPTMSPSLWVQMVGRVSRLSPGKVDGLVLDFTENSWTHGPVDLIECDSTGELKTAPYCICHKCGYISPPKTFECEKCGVKFVKECISCKSLIPKDNTVCDLCGSWQTREKKICHNDTISSAPVLSDQTTVVEVDQWEAEEWRKEGKPPSIRVRYWSGITQYSEWVCPEHGGYATRRAQQWWARHGGGELPETTEAALRLFKTLTQPETCEIRRNGRYWNVVD